MITEAIWAIFVLVWPASYQAPIMKAETSLAQVCIELSKEPELRIFMVRIDDKNFTPDFNEVKVICPEGRPQIINIGKSNDDSR